MTKTKKWLAIAGVGMAVMLLVGAALPAAASTAVAAPVAHRGGIGGGADSQYLADALGITVAELQTAQETANKAAIQQAVDDGLITQAQADWMLQNNGGFRGFRGLPWGASSTIDPEALLADALNITVEQLQTAKDTAFKAELAQAVTDGQITQEQADLMQARHDLQTYLQEQDLDGQVQSLYSNALKQAVTAGVLTQAQADALQNSGFGLGGRHGFGGLDGFDGPHGRGGMRGFGIPDNGTGTQQPQQPSTAPTGFGI